jgi:hypothetical protein
MARKKKSNFLPTGKKVKWGSTKYLKKGALYFLAEPGFVAWWNIKNDSIVLNASIDLPENSYMIYLGEEYNTITYWKFWHLGLNENIVAANNDFAQDILEISEAGS